MARHAHRLTPVPPGSDAVPRRAWVEFADGTTEELELTPVPGTRDAWTARPRGGREVTVGAGDHLRVDVLCAGCQVTFANITSET